MDKEIFERVDAYILDLVGGEDDVLRAADNSIAASNLPPISVSANQGKFLHVLAKACGAKKILEIGTLAGYSAIWMARALPPGAKLITLEFDPEHARVAQTNIERADLANLIDIRVGKAIELLPELTGEGPFDMIFIDADKPPYTEYFTWSLKLSRPGTLIIADNVIREGKVLDKQSNDDMVMGVQRFNQYLSSCTDVTATIIQTVGSKMHDGMAIAVVK
jgi:caffeoyl-CoA O-methyltransferase